jgi:transposase
MCQAKKEKCEYIVELERLRAENEQLKIELEKYQKPKKDSSNSSIPSSQEKYDKKYPERECSNHKSGGQKGHKGYTKIQVENPDKVTEIYPEKCSYCGCTHLFKQTQKF